MGAAAHAAKAAIDAPRRILLLCDTRDVQNVIKTVARLVLLLYRVAVYP